MYSSKLSLDVIFHLPTNCSTIVSLQYLTKTNKNWMIAIQKKVQYNIFLFTCILGCKGAEQNRSEFKEFRKRGQPHWPISNIGCDAWKMWLVKRIWKGGVWYEDLNVWGSEIVHFWIIIQSGLLICVSKNKILYIQLFKLKHLSLKQICIFKICCKKIIYVTCLFEIIYSCLFTFHRVYDRTGMALSTDG